MMRIVGLFSGLRVGVVTQSSRMFSTGGVSLVAAAAAKGKPARKPVKKAPAKAKNAKAKKVKAKKPVAVKAKPKKKKQPTKKELLDALLKAPKKAAGPYSLFVQEQAKIQMAKGNTSVTENARIYSAAWRGMDDAARQPYRERADALSAEHEETLRKWWNAADHSLVALENQRRRRVDGKKARLLKDPNAPKRPLTAYTLFAKEYLAGQGDAQKGGIGAMTVLMREAGAKWKAMAEGEKAPFQKAADVERSRYKQDMEKYLKSHTVGGASHI
ncbi:hypothetical protein GGF43_004575 [Coemansia sp. RSA 2618]|nr:hypothetical protein GGF43_004575 [Coemansia sp. RSA 2618]